MTTSFSRENISQQHNTSTTLDYNFNNAIIQMKKFNEENEAKANMIILMITQGSDRTACQGYENTGIDY